MVWRHLNSYQPILSIFNKSKSCVGESVTRIRQVHFWSIWWSILIANIACKQSAVNHVTFTFTFYNLVLIFEEENKKKQLSFICSSLFIKNSSKFLQS